uniref:Large ribosomal subunit protein uL2c n=1 Tax=Lepocinclis ovum TaxID=86638 RepID=A0A3G3LM00_9EUGL|nr:ribosomal protein L2 [Lepocinclis ovum]AYQ93736.1 ribosomal protein L2 [Lepocinclis ovum]
MSIRFYKPYTSSTRNRSISDFFDITKCFPEKKLTFFIHTARGRNSRGVITSRHRGGGHKRLYRLIDFKRDKLAIFAKVFSIEYDPNRNSRISLIVYDDGEKRYILHVSGLVIGDLVVSNFNVPIKLGNALPLGRIPLGTNVHNIEFQSGRGGQVARSAGAFAKIIAHQASTVMIQLPSGKLRFFQKVCWATIGQVGNVEFSSFVKSKAGSNRWLGKRPHVRGSAMNPCDHPLGGGEGRTGVGRLRPVTPWGKPALGKKTRRSKRYSDVFLVD